MNQWSIIGLCLFCYALGVLGRNVDKSDETSTGSAVVAFIVAVIIFIVRITLLLQ